MSRRNPRARSRTRAKSRRGFRWRRWLLALLLPGLLGTVLPVLLWRFVDPPTTAFMLARQWEARSAGDADFRLRHDWQPLSRISPQLGLAVVASEDQKFPDHHGFDVDAIEAAIAARQQGGRLRGASTISQQLAKNLFLWSGRSFVRKGLEAWFTLLIETAWPKRRILEVYLNVVEFGDGVYGAEAAAQHFFAKPASALTAEESALLAATLPNPRAYRADRPGPYLRERQAWILRQMRQLGGPAYLAY
ncbi:MAG: monofunctional biosynthetic peptidoglycan transglycosylase [Xanthomonadales bacterium]|nr:monofunctional biosynthetic peptidoglycan transglycosylase [Xanthomonadales bacterium]